VIVRTDLPSALEHFNIDPLFGETREKPADSVRRPTHCFGDRGTADTFVASLIAAASGRN
jgi:hypothetical protein